MATLAHQIAERIHRPRYEDITQAALEWTLDYTRQRQAFGRPLAEFQTNSMLLAFA